MENNPGEKEKGQDNEEMRFRENKAPQQPGGDNGHDHIGNGHAKEAVGMYPLAGFAQDVSVLAE
jgi:hypothetical protein